jgi:two-component system chemotaxis sensor kinase CheA
LFSDTDSGTRTNVLEQTHFGRRNADREATTPTWGRRSSDRLHLDRSSIRVDTEKVDRLLNLIGELVIAHSMLSETAVRSGIARNGPLRDSVNYVGRQTRELQDAVMSIRLLPIDVLFSRTPRLTHDLAERLGKEVDLTTQGGETELDKEMIEKLADPLTHLVRNAIDHGIEPTAQRLAAGKPRRGRIELRATHQSGSILIEVRDDGRGLDRQRILHKARERGLPGNPEMSDAEVWQLVFTPGFSTAETVNDISGRGVGMDIVKRNISLLGGHIEIDSHEGLGTSISIRLPLTLAILDGMSVDVGGETFIIPLSFISEAFLPGADQIKPVTGGPHVVCLRDEYLPLLILEQLVGVRTRGNFPDDGIAIVVEYEGRRAAIFVDSLLGQQQVVIKNLEQNYRRIPGIGGATVLGNGRVALILDINALLRLGLSDSVPESRLAQVNTE